MSGVGLTVTRREVEFASTNYFCAEASRGDMKLAGNVYCRPAVGSLRANKGELRDSRRFRYG